MDVDPGESYLRLDMTRGLLTRFHRILLWGIKDSDWDAFGGGGDVSLLDINEWLLAWHRQFSLRKSFDLLLSYFPFTFLPMPSPLSRIVILMFFLRSAKSTENAYGG